MAPLPMWLEYDFGSISAIWTAFNNLSSHSNQQFAFTCATGNCTWPPHASLAVCSACNDISTHLVKSTGHAENSEDTTFPPGYMSGPDGDNAYTKFELPTMNMIISNLDNRGSQVEFTCQSTTQPGSTLSFQNSRALIVSFAMMRVNTNTPRSSGATALECALSFCTNICRSTVNEGVLNEEVLGSYSIRNLDSYSAFPGLNSLNQSKALDKVSNYTLDFHDLGDFRRTDLQLQIPVNDNVTALISNNDLSFNISDAAITTLAAISMDKFARRPPPL
ncbi:hypothetical protein BDP81DRAFT_434401 [Colletotrichum phormii]|uniref:Uncharacterized protein n=1 Tax=Colletotrichum phormii TaxID=359342 RepID=A0AAJ0EE91_9PEZI|nr:uncharacterized protein BDP81DRAFT_434401 [Colletotrichum phormii]KAK1633760.1 hypothetical protein BDP81DRAFT_434401 [Colletotrichum phormii]